MRVRERLSGMRRSGGEHRTAGESGGAPMVYVQRVGSSEAHAITGSGGASYPFWSPDNASVAFFANGKLRKAATSGGSPQNLETVGTAPRA